MYKNLKEREKYIFIEIKRLLNYLLTEIDYSEQIANLGDSPYICKMQQMVDAAHHTIAILGNIRGVVDYLDEEDESGDCLINSDENEKKDKKQFNITVFKKIYFDEIALFFYESLESEMKSFVSNNQDFKGEAIKLAITAMSEHIKSINTHISIFENFKRIKDNEDQKGT
jgi:hypothetical protein